jgi:hypothetical protein
VEGGGEKDTLGGDRRKQKMRFSNDDEHRWEYSVPICNYRTAYDLLKS